jgi:NTP pyrophosphatase (non-canonical NTP hydrolase)
MSDSPIPWRTTSKAFDDLWSTDTDSDIDPTTGVPDTLVTIFTQQRTLMRGVWPKELASGLSVLTSEFEWGEVTNRRVQARIQETYAALVRELSEAMQCLDGSKSWKENPRPVDVEAFREEIADAFHFFVEFCILSGLDAESLFREYFKKALVNTARVENGY